MNFFYISTFFNYIFYIGLFIDGIIDYLYDLIIITSYNYIDSFEKKSNLSKSIEIDNFAEFVKQTDEPVKQSDEHVKQSDEHVKQTSNLNLEKIIISSDVENLKKYIESNNQINYLPMYNLILQNKKFNLTNIVVKYHYPIDSNILNICISLGDINQIDNLLNNGCYWTIYSFSYGLISSNPKVLEFIRKKGCFWGITLDEHLVIAKSNCEIVNWLKNNNCPWIL